MRGFVSGLSMSFAGIMRYRRSAPYQSPDFGQMSAISVFQNLKKCGMPCGYFRTDCAKLLMWDKGFLPRAAHSSGEDSSTSRSQPRTALPFCTNSRVELGCTNCRGQSGPTCQATISVRPDGGLLAAFLRCYSTTLGQVEVPGDSRRLSTERDTL